MRFRRSLPLLSQEQLISGNSPELGCQRALAIVHPCGDELDILGVLERGGLFPVGYFRAPAVVPGVLCRWRERPVRGRCRSLPKENTSRAETR